jgi:hypothetical protein
MGLCCKRCGSEEHVKNGLMRGQQRATAVSEISCVGRAVDPIQAMARVKRSPKRMAN